MNFMKMKITQLLRPGIISGSWFIIFKQFLQSLGKKYQPVPAIKNTGGFYFNDTKPSLPADRTAIYRQA
jgi:hypothetical protein